VVRFNVAGGLFYGPEVYHSGLSRATLSGAAALLFYYCVAGICFGWLADPASRLRTLLRAATVGRPAARVASFCVWPAMGVFAPLWFAWKTTLPADLLLLLALARFPIHYRRLAEFHGAGRGRRRAWWNRSNYSPKRLPPTLRFQAPRRERFPLLRPSIVLGCFNPLE